MSTTRPITELVGLFVGVVFQLAAVAIWVGTLWVGITDRDDFIQDYGYAGWLGGLLILLPMLMGLAYVSYMIVMIPVAAMLKVGTRRSRPQP